MMSVRMSLLALCAFAAIATASVGAVPFPDSPTTEACVRKLAENLKSLAVPEEASALAAALEADVAYDNGDGWDELNEEVRAKHAANYPTDICKKFQEQLGEISEKTVAEGSCLPWQLSSSVHAMKLAEKNPISAPYMKAGKACDAIMPDEEEEENEEEEDKEEKDAKIEQE